MLVLILVAICLTPRLATGQDSQPIMYHWVSEDTVYLWRTVADETWVTANRSGLQWQFLPKVAETDRAWLDTLRSGPAKNVQPDRAWDFFLGTFLAEYPDDAWAQPRYPDVQIYLVKASEQSAKIVFITSSALKEYAFQKRKERWEKSEEIPVSKILNLSEERDSQVVKVFSSSKIAATATEWQYKDLWHHWITESIEEPAGPRSVMYRDSSGALRWLWQELISVDVFAERLRKKMARKILATRQTEAKQSLVVGPGPLYRRWWFSGFLGILVGALAASAVGRLTAPRAEQGKQPDQQRDVVPLREQGKLDRIIQLLEQHIEFEKKFVIVRLSFENLEPERAKQLIDLGKLAEKCYRALLQTGEEGQLTALRPSDDSPAAWFERLPGWVRNSAQELHALRGNARLSTEKIESLERHLSLTETTLSAAKNELKNLTATLGSLQAERTSLKASLEQKTEEIKNLTAEYDRARSDTVSLRAERETLQAKFQEVDRLSRLVPYIQQGQRTYLEENSPESAAIVSYLIHHSLLQLFLAVLKGEQERKVAMLGNLYSIAKKLKKLRGFDPALRDLEKNSPGIESLRETLVPTEQSHFDDKLFQVLLKRLRDQSRLDLAPFYFDVDNKGQAHYAN